MSEIIVYVKEVHIQKVKIEAEGIDDAINKVASGEGDEYGELTYHSTLDPSTWSVGEN